MTEAEGDEAGKRVRLAAKLELMSDLIDAYRDARENEATNAAAVLDQLLVEVAGELRKFAHTIARGLDE